MHQERTGRPAPATKEVARRLRHYGAFRTSPESLLEVRATRNRELYAVLARVFRRSLIHPTGRVLVVMICDGSGQDCFVATRLVDAVWLRAGL